MNVHFACHHHVVAAKKCELIASAERLNRGCYREQIRLLSSYDEVATTVSRSPPRPRRLLCAREKEYLSSAYIFVMRMLTLLRDDTRIFQYLMQTIEGMDSLSGRFLDSLAEELVLLFLADFTSGERQTLCVLRHLEPLLRVPFLPGSCRICVESLPKIC